MYEPIKGYKVKCIRLNTGEVFMGFVKPEKNGYKIIEPQIILTVADNNQMEVNFAPWIPYARDFHFKVLDQQIQTVFDPNPTLTQNFKSVTGNQPRGDLIEFIKEESKVE